MALFTRYVKTIKGAAHKNGDIDGMCKRTLSANTDQKKFSPSLLFLISVNVPLNLDGNGYFITLSVNKPLIISSEVRFVLTYLYRPTFYHFLSCSPNETQFHLFFKSEFLI